MNLNVSKINLGALTKKANILFTLELEIDYSKEAIAHKNTADRSVYTKINP